MVQGVEVFVLASMRRIAYFKRYVLRCSMVVNITMEGRYRGPHAVIDACAEKLKDEGIETVVVFPDKD